MQFLGKIGQNDRFAPPLGWRHCYGNKKKRTLVLLAPLNHGGWFEHIVILNVHLQVVVELEFFRQ